MACEESSITIPQDIIAEILYRLPVKSVGRFRCVSKEWLSLLSEPQFIKIHQKTRNRNCFIFWTYHSSLYSVPFNNHKAVSRLAKLPVESSVVNRDYVEFFGSCNGLVLASSHDLRWFGKFVVVNLITRDYVEFLMFRHQLSHIIKRVGFGYDSVTDYYKVVSICYYHYMYLDPPDNDVYVYSLRSDTWRKVSDSPFDHYSYGEGLSGVFVNGFLHWIAGNDSDHGVIAAFGLADEKFCEVPSPYLYNDADILSYSRNCNLVALGEKLTMFDDVEGVVWLMNEYGVKESWTKILVHGFNEISMYEPEIFYDNRKLLFVTRYIMWIYDLEEGTFCETADIFDMHLWRVKCAYVESLVSPKVGKSNYRSSISSE